MVQDFKFANQIWAESIGGFIINFGAVERLTFRWIAAIGGGNGKFAYQGGKKVPPLKDQIKEIVAAISTSKLSEQDKIRAKELWSEIDSLVELRNRIAHNPINISTDPATGKEALCVHDLKRIYRERGNSFDGQDIDYIGISTIRDAAYKTAATVLQLRKII